MGPYHATRMDMHTRMHIHTHRHTHTTHYTIFSQTCIKAGLDEPTTRKLLAHTQDQDIKDKLKATTQEAFELGVRHTLISA